MLEKKISLNTNNPTEILGSNDKYLKKISNHFENARIYVRGNDVFVKGEQDDLNALEKVFLELIFIAGKHGKVTEADVSTVLDLVSVGKSVAREDFDNVVLFTRNDSIKCKTEGQRAYVKIAQKKDIVFCIGPAGTGKTYLAVAMAVSALKNKDVQRIVLTRPAVEAGESLGFLPGDMREKVDPYLRPLYDALADMIPSEKMEEYMQRKVIEIVPLAFMRGRTLANSFVILDEAQNTTFTQLKMFLTRLGLNSKAIITGDMTQIDLPHRQDSGLVRASEILGHIEGIGFTYLDKTDVVRHRLVKDIIEAYDIYEDKRDQAKFTAETLAKEKKQRVS